MRTPPSSSERLNAVLELMPSKRYLEIGVAHGNTFFGVEACEKVAVDPRFRFDPIERRTQNNETFHPLNSDAFFAGAIGQMAPFDLIFLDGLHTFPQTLRDFLSSMALSHSRTVWLIDDTRPTSSVAAEPCLDRVRQVRSLQGCAEDNTWMGDVFKVVAFIDSFLPQFTCLTTEGHGQTFVIPSARTKPSGCFTSPEAITSLNYIDSVLLGENLLKATPFDEIIGTIAAIFK